MIFFEILTINIKFVAFLISIIQYIVYKKIYHCCTYKAIVLYINTKLISRVNIYIIYSLQCVAKLPIQDAVFNNFFIEMDEKKN